LDHIKDLSQYILNAYEADGTLPVANESILTSGCTDDVDRFNRDPENFVVDQEPCFDELDGVQFFGGLTYTQVVDDIRRKFECLIYSFLVSSNRCGPGDSSCGIGQSV
jgi:hypothetical protein